MKTLFLGFLVLLNLNTFSQTKVTGAGATFPQAIYSKWFMEYSKLNKDSQFDYQPIGSGGGVRQLINQTVDFGASDAALTEKDIADAKFPIQHVPTVLGAVAVSYNVEGLKNGLKLDGQLIADIYLGKITKWNDSGIAKLNPELNLPDKDILVARRADGSGTTAVFAEYLADVSAEWKSKVGVGKTLSWPTGIGGKGNDGVTAIVKQTDGAIGYIDLAHAQKNNLSIAAIKNKKNEYIIPTVTSVSLAATNLPEGNKDFTFSVINQDVGGAYPISAFTFILLPLKAKDQKLTEIHKFLKWALTDGQNYAAGLFFSPLPLNLRKNVLDMINKL